MHSLLVFTIFDYSVMVLTLRQIILLKNVRTLDALESGLSFREVAKNFLDLLFCKVVCSSLIIPDIKVLIQFRHFSLCKPQLSQIVPAVVAEV